MSYANLPPVIVSDWDLTLIPTFTIIPWVKFLTSHNLFLSHELDKIQILFRKFTDNSIKYETFCESVGILYARGLIAQDKKKVYKAATDFVNKDVLKLYNFTYKAFSLLKQHDLKMFIISGAPLEPLKAYSKKFGFKIIGGLEAEATYYNLYTGELLGNSGLLEKKADLVKKISLNNRIVLAFGDSISDIPLLKAASSGILVSTPFTDSSKFKELKIRVLDPNELNHNIEEIISLLKKGG